METITIKKEDYDLMVKGCEKLMEVIEENNRLKTPTETELDFSGLKSVLGIEDTNTTDAVKVWENNED